MTKDDILFEIETLKNNIKYYLPERLNGSESEKTHFTIFPEELDNYFFMIHFHKTDYERYLLLENYITACHKETLYDLSKELSLWNTKKQNILKEISLLNKNTTEETEINNCNFYINEITGKINEITDILKNHKIYKKDEEIISEEKKPLYEIWKKIKTLEIKFNDLRNNEKTDIEEINKKILHGEKEMIEKINLFNV